MKTAAEWAKWFLRPCEPTPETIADIAAFQADALRTGFAMGLEAAAKLIDEWNGNREENPRHLCATGHMIYALPLPESLPAEEKP